MHTNEYEFNDDYDKLKDSFGKFLDLLCYFHLIHPYDDTKCKIVFDQDDFAILFNRIYRSCLKPQSNIKRD